MNRDIYDRLRQPPKTALKKITGGRIGGMTDINPQWRYEAMTEEFGPCGIGWTYETVKEWLEPCGDQIAAFVDILLYVKYENEWSRGIPGTGGSMFAAKESRGIHVSDECFKMATTDALSVAMKMLGVGGDIYAGKWDGSKYADAPKVKPEAKKELTDKQLHGYPMPAGDDKDRKLKDISADDLSKILDWLREQGKAVDSEKIAIIERYLEKYHSTAGRNADSAKMLGESK